jgi:hypothetical protein
VGSTVSRTPRVWAQHPTDLPPTICADPSEKLRDSSIFRAMM